MMFPDPRSFIAGRKLLIVRNVRVRLASTDARQASTSISSRRPGLVRLAPAFATRMSTGPSSRSICSRAASTSSNAVSSATTCVTRPPVPSISAATSPSAERSRPWTATIAPSLANSFAIAAPIPRELPVTSETLPFSDATKVTPSSRRSHLPPALERLRKRHLIRVFEIAADGKPAREPSHCDADRLEHRRHVHRGGVALQVRVGRQDHLGHAVAFDAIEQLLHAKVFGSDAVERADRAAKHVVPALDHAGLLDRGDVLWLLDDAERRPVP